MKKIKFSSMMLVLVLTFTISSIYSQTTTLCGTNYEVLHTASPPGCSGYITTYYVIQDFESWDNYCMDISTPQNYVELIIKVTKINGGSQTINVGIGASDNNYSVFGQSGGDSYLTEASPLTGFTNYFARVDLSQMVDFEERCVSFRVRPEYTFMDLGANTFISFKSRDEGGVQNFCFETSEDVAHFQGINLSIIETYLDNSQHLISVVYNNNSNPCSQQTNAGAIQLNGELIADIDYCFKGAQSASEDLDIILMGPDAKITVESGVTLSFENFNIQSCEDMWEKIHVNDGAKLYLKNCTFQHGQKTIYLDGNAELEMSNSDIRNSVYGIYAEGSLGDVLVIENFENNRFHDNSDMRFFPNSSVQGNLRDAINVNEYDYVALSSSDPLLPNVFDGWTKGVKCTNSNLACSDNQFINNETGIYAQGLSSHYFRENRFTSNNTSIDVFNGGLRAIDNRVTGGLIGIDLKFTDQFGMNIKGNDITTTTFGIRNILQSRGSILENLIDVDMGSSSAIGINAILVNHTNTKENIIKVGEIRAGISVLSSTLNDYQENTINMSVPNSDTDGVRFEGSDNNDISCNKVNGPSTGGFTESTSLRVLNSPMNIYGCNEFLDTEEGLLFLSTSDLSVIQGNTFGDSGRGLQVSEPNFNSNVYIGVDQVHTGNKWTGTYSQFAAAHYSSAPSPALSTLFFADPDPTKSFWPSPIHVESAVNWFIPQTPPSTYACTGQNACDNNQAGAGFTGGTNPNDLFNPWVYTGLPTDTLHTDDEKWVTTYQTYDGIINHIDPINYDTWMQDMVEEYEFTDLYYIVQAETSIKEAIQFYPALVPFADNIDTLQVEIDDLIQSGAAQSLIDTKIADLQSNYQSYLNTYPAYESAAIASLLDATTNLGNITGTENIVTTFHDVLNVMVDYLSNDFTLSSSDITYLSSVVNLCPYSYGKSIYYARALLSLTGYVVNDDLVNCEVPKERSERRVSNKIKLLPNPASNYFILDFEGDVSGVIISDVTGKIWQTYNEVKSGEKIELGENLPAGIYNINITRSDGISETKKLVRIK